MLCILYVTAVGVLLGIAALLVERVLPPAWPRRWMWCVVIAMNVVLPGIYRSHHAASVRGVLGAAGAGSDWLAFIEACDPVINRLWLLTSAMLILWGLAGAWRIARGTHGGRSVRAVVDDVPLVVTDSLGPATVGLLRSRVLVPRWVLALPGVQRRYVLRHEDEHRRAHDGRLLFVASLAIVLMPWNLAIWWLVRRLALAIELDCDHRVVSALGDADAYSALLFKVAEVANRGPMLQPAFLGGTGTLERRLRALLDPTPLRTMQRVLLPVLAGAIIIVVLAMPHPVSAHPGAHAAHSSHMLHAR